MSTSLIGRVLRPATLLVAGMLLGQVTIAVTTSPTSAATVQTRVSSCAGPSFHPLESSIRYQPNGRGITLHASAGGSDHLFACDPKLPHKAVVTKVRFTVSDYSEVMDVRDCSLLRASLGAAFAVPEVMGSVPTTGVTAEPEQIRMSDVTIRRATIDNALYGYWLQCDMHVGGADDSGFVQIIGAVVTYTISSTNG